MNVFRNPFTWFTFYLMNDVRIRFVIGFRMSLRNFFISWIEYKLYTYFLSITYFIICTFLHPPTSLSQKRPEKIASLRSSQALFVTVLVFSPII